MNARSNRGSRRTVGGPPPRDESGAATPARLYDEEKQRQLERDTKREMILRKRDEDFDQRHPFQPSMVRPRRPRDAIE